jgi:hypothetical protein
MTTKRVAPVDDGREEEPVARRKTKRRRRAASRPSRRGGGGRIDWGSRFAAAAGGTYETPYRNSDGSPKPGAYGTAAEGGQFG